MVNRMMSVILRAAECPRRLRCVASGAAYHRMLCLLLLGTGCSWGADLDNLAVSRNSSDASPGRDTSRDALLVDRMGQDSPDVAPDQEGCLGGAVGYSRDAGNDGAHDFVATNGIFPYSQGEDAFVLGDAGLETAQDVPTDNTSDNTISDSGDLATESLPADTATACSVPPPVSTTMTLSSAVSFVTACGYIGSTLPRIQASVDPHTFAASAACGMCILIQTAAATVEAMVVDLGGASGAVNSTAIAVSKSGMDLLVPDGSTYVTQDVHWKVTACTLRNPGMSFTFQVGSNANYAAILVQNHRYGLAKVEYKTGTTYKALLRMPYNFWVAPQGMGSGPFTFRLTDQFGQTVEQPGIPLAPGQIFNGESQFPLCSAS